MLVTCENILWRGGMAVQGIDKHKYIADKGNATTGLKHNIMYPNIPSAVRPVPHSESIPVPFPFNVKLSTDTDSDGDTSDEMYQPSKNLMIWFAI
ncbi:hypothetical protein ILUMI_18745 [Ignelater luminosus]|uniref:Uncharacterized protein n=1 Tax=Ignelater luminosus TaxID=2038154 RepID=A0A8K0G6J9_IGNLU|nr:hypothetical protein ILUMI_23822 [Ignelater luminosus]KAF2887428.1 hypothetical protein ILUMI_18745 [Ignelater luminosus]